MQEPALEYLRHGQIPFFRLPGRPSGEIADAAVLGVPHDGGTTYQPGARFAPYHVRRVSALVQGYHPQHAIDVFAALDCIDGGNIVFPPFDRAAMRSAVEQEIRKLAAKGTAPLMIGGDHSITLPALRALSRKHGPLAVVHFDAHLDVSGPEVWGDDHHHGTPIRHAIADGLIEDGALFQIGIRGPRSAATDDALVQSRGHTVITADAVGEREPKRVTAERL